MNDDKMAKDYHIEGGSVLHLVSAAACHTYFLLSCRMWNMRHLLAVFTPDPHCAAPQVLALRGGQLEQAICISQAATL